MVYVLIYQGEGTSVGCQMDAGRPGPEVGELQGTVVRRAQNSDSEPAVAERFLHACSPRCRSFKRSLKSKSHRLSNSSQTQESSRFPPHSSDQTHTEADSCIEADLGTASARIAMAFETLVRRGRLLQKSKELATLFKR